MKKILYFIVASVALTACSSAAEEEIVKEPETNQKQMTFRATVNGSGDDTRAYLSSEKNAQEEYDVLWSAGDAISVFNTIFVNRSGNLTPSTVNSDNSKMTLTAGAETTEATFSGACTSSNFGYVAAYPYNANTTFITESGVTYNWNSTQQTSCLGSFPVETLMLASCISSSDVLEFKHVYSFIKFTTTGACKSVTFKANNSNAKIACTKLNVKFDYTERAIQLGELTKTGSSNQITLTGKDNANLAAGTYYIAVLPCTMTGGFEIAFTNTDSSSAYTRSTTKDVTVTRAEALNLGTFDLQKVFTGQASTEDLVSGGDFEW